MKRFLVDALLVLLFVSIASYISEPKEKENMSEKIKVFEQQIAEQKPIEQMVENTYLNEIYENGASRLANAGSNLVIDIMDTSIHVVSELVQGFINR